MRYLFLLLLAACSRHPAEPQLTCIDVRWCDSVVKVDTTGVCKCPPKNA